MGYKFRLLLLSLFFQVKITAQHPTNSFIVHDSLPTAFEFDLSKYTTLHPPESFKYYATEGKFNFSQKPFSAQAVVKPFLQPINNISLSFSIYNSSTRNRTLYFECGRPDLFKLTDLDDTSKRILTGGFLGTSNKISPFSPNKYLPVVLPPNKISRFLVYAKFMGTYKEKIIPRILSEKSYQLNSIREIDRTRLQLIYHSFILGGIFFISIFMIAQFFLNRDKAYLLYAAYGISIFLLAEKIMELNCGILLISYFVPGYVFYSHIFLQLLASYFYIGFLKKLLELSTREKTIYYYCVIMQVLILIACVFLCATLFFMESPALVSAAYNFGALVSTVAMFPLLILLLFLKRKDPSVKYVIAGFSAVVISVLAVVYINRSGLYSQYNLLAPISIIEFGIFVEMIFFGLALGYKTHKQKLEKENIELQKQETEMAALKAQMNPHFIFNCINSIDAFIHSNDKYNATLYLNKFAKLLRNILDSSKQNTVAFSKDIDTLKLYIELEELRHENKFKTNISIEDELLSNDYKVPPLIIQPFVENAILHGLKNRVDNAGLLQIEIKKVLDKIEYKIKDNGIGRKAAGLIVQNNRSSYGVQMSYDRVKLFNKEEKPSVQITDLYIDDIAAGTEVKIILNII